MDGGAINVGSGCARSVLSLARAIAGAGDAMDDAGAIKVCSCVRVCVLVCVCRLGHLRPHRRVRAYVNLAAIDTRTYAHTHTHARARRLSTPPLARSTSTRRARTRAPRARASAGRRRSTSTPRSPRTRGARACRASSAHVRACVRVCARRARVCAPAPAPVRCVLIRMYHSHALLEARDVREPRRAPAELPRGGRAGGRAGERAQHRHARVGRARRLSGAREVLGLGGRVGTRAHARARVYVRASACKSVSACVCMHARARVRVCISL